MFTFRYYLFLSILIFWTTLCSATSQPIIVNTQGNIPSIAYINKSYTVTYTLINQLGFNMPTPLNIEKYSSSNEFTITDQCNGKALANNESCTIKVLFKPTRAGIETLKLIMGYAHYRVPFANLHITSKSEVIVEKKTSIPLDNNIAIGLKYPIQLTFTNPATNPTITNLETINKFPTGFKLSENTCAGRKQLLPGLSCYINGNVIPVKTGIIKIATTLTYTEGRPITAETSGTAENVVVKGETTTPLEPNIAVGIKYPVQFTFTNTSPNVPATGMTFTYDFPNDFKVDENTCKVKTTLQRNESCYIKGNITPSKTGPINIMATLKYAEGQAIPVDTHSNAENVVVKGKTTTPLEPNIAVGIKYPVQFTFTNTSPNVPATGMTFTYDFPNDFKVDENTCKVKTTLQHSESCYIKGNITSSKTGPINIATTLKYTEGQDVPISTNSSAEKVVVNGEATIPLNANIAIGIKYPIQLTFTNTSANIAATKLQFLPNFESDFTVNTNTCQDITTLEPTKSCYVSGKLLPTTPNDHTVAATLNYAEGQPVLATTSGSAEKVVVNGEATIPLNANIAIGIKYPIQLTFTNTSANIAATKLQFLPNFESDFTVNTNTCQDITTLEPTKSCYVSGELLPTTPNDHTVAATLNYAEGQPVLATTSGSAEKVVVNGEATLKLEPNIAANVEYPVQLTFANTSTHVTATNLNLTTNFPVEFTEDTNTCANKSNLSAKDSCYVYGKFKSNKIGRVNIMATLHYKEGQPGIAKTQASIENVVIVGKVNTLLPANLAVGVEYPIKITFTNTATNVSATNLNLIYKFPSSFTEGKNTCKGKNSLLPTESCSINGTVKPTTTGLISVGATLHYKEGQPISKQTDGSAENVVVTTTEPHKIPENIEINSINPIEIKFTNTAAKVKATQINIQVTNPDNYLSITENDCKSELLASKSCTIKGNYTAGSEGTKYAALSFSYREGNTITIPMKTFITKAKEYPAAVSDGSSYANSELYNDVNVTNFIEPQAPTLFDGKSFVNPIWGAILLYHINGRINKKRRWKTISIYLQRL